MGRTCLIAAASALLLGGSADAAGVTERGRGAVAASASIFKHIHPRGSRPGQLTVAGDQLFFVARDVRHGRELWVTDGTAGGTHITRDIEPGRAGSGIQHVTAVGATVFFGVRSSGRHDPQLWRSDGTRRGTQLVSEETGDISGPKAAGGQLFFNGNDYEHGEELWRSDGTPAGTRMVKDIYRPPPGEASDAFWYGSRPTQTEAAGDVVFFVATDGLFPEPPAEPDAHVWRSDGTADGTHRVEENEWDPGAQPRGLTFVGGSLYFVAASDGVMRLWRSDGTSAGTRPVAVLDNRDPYWMKAVAGSLVFAVRNAHYAASLYEPPGWELWRSDGTSTGTQPFRTFEPGVTDWSEQPRPLVDVAGTLFFGADDALWRSDRTVAGTVRVKEIGQAGPVGRARAWAVVGDVAYFAGWDSRSMRRLWRSDGTRAGTVRVAGGAREPRSLQVLGSTVFFGAHPAGADETERELWRVDP